MRILSNVTPLCMVMKLMVSVAYSYCYLVINVLYFYLSIFFSLVSLQTI